MGRYAASSCWSSWRLLAVAEVIRIAVPGGLLKIRPHPGLSDKQRHAIEIDQGMVEGRTQIPVHRALLFYVLKPL